MMIPSPIVSEPVIVSPPTATKSVEAEVAAVPNPKLVLAAEALDAPVPPLAIDKSVPDQSLLFIVES